MRGARRWGALAAGLAIVVAAAGATGGTHRSSRAADRDRLGVRQQGSDGPVRRPGARSREDSRQAGQRQGRRRRPAATASTPATRRTTTRRARSRAHGGCSASGADIIFTTCDVDFATPVVQEAINRGVLAIAPCIGTDQMGPKRFGKTKGRLAFSFGNVAQDEGSAMAEYAYRRGWRTAGLATNTLLVYFKNVVQAFDKRFTQLGGRIVARESYATGANNVQTAVSRLNSRRADVYVTSTAFGELPAFVSGFARSGTRRRSSTRGPATAPTGRRRARRSPTTTRSPTPRSSATTRTRPCASSRSPVKAGTGGFVAGAGRDRRGRHRDQAGERLDERCGARDPAGEVQEGADDLRQGELLEAAAQRVRTPVPRDPDPRQQGARSSARVTAKVVPKI